MADLDHLVQRTAPVTVEVFAPPSSEARWLARHLSWLVAPEGGSPKWYTRLLGVSVVAPFTQFTVLSFDLQAFLFSVFHTRVWARLGHGLFMPMVNFFVMVALAQLRVGPHPTEHGWSGPSLNGATLYAALLLAWYLAVASSARLYLWWAATVPLTLALAFGADAYYCHTFTLETAARSWYAPTPTLFNPWLWMTVSSFIIAASHAPEPKLPPRVGDPWRWMSLPESILGTRAQPNPPLLRLARASKVALQLVTGTLNEWWASPRLMPYNLLMLMFAAGYRPDVGEQAKTFAARALASGNPAIDYIGIGGGSFLRPDALTPAVEPHPAPGAT
jgi:hypothetical protein